MAEYYRHAFCCECGGDSITLRTGSCFIEVKVFLFLFFWYFFFCAKPGCVTNAPCYIGLRQFHIEALVRGVIAFTAEGDKRQLEVMSR